MKKILFLTLIAGALLFSASCQREGVIYDFPKDAALLSFPNNKLNWQMVAEDGNKIVAQLHRGNTKGALSVPFEFSDGTAGVFTPSKTTFDFADGENVASVEITYPDINDFAGEVFKMKLAVDEEQVSPSGYSEMTVSAQRKLTPVLLGEGTWYSGFLSIVYDKDVTWKQKIYNTKEAPNYYILPDCWKKGYDFSFMMVDGVPVWPDEVDTGLSVAELFDNPGYASLGNFWLVPGESEIADGMLMLMTDVIYSHGVDDYSLLEMETPEYFIPPKGVEIK